MKTLTLTPAQVAIYALAEAGDGQAADALMRELRAALGGPGEVVHPDGFTVLVVD